jgi:hypothetical protein
MAVESVHKQKISNYVENGSMMPVIISFSSFFALYSYKTLNQQQFSYASKIVAILLRIFCYSIAIMLFYSKITSLY